jgi:phosphoribosylglycinamide formyltransferase-1
MRIAMLASHEGSTVQAVIDAIAAGRLTARLCLVLSNNRNSGALVRASSAGIPTAYLSRATHPDATELDRAICSALERSRCDLVVLAGYMRKIGPSTLARYCSRILNTHPSLLPRHGGKGMRGRRAHEAVLASGDDETGVSLHLVDGEYDTGCVVAQAKLAIEAGESVESLETRVRALERKFLCDSLQRIAVGELCLGAAGQGGGQTSDAAWRSG